MRRGFSTKEIMLALLVLVVAGGVIFVVGKSLANRQQALGDIDNMRKVYLAVALYETEENGFLPPDLLATRDRAPDDGVFQARNDPYAQGAAALGNESLFPVDGGLPSWRVESPIRISFAFLGSFVTAGKASVKPWAELKFDPTVGFLANEWEGSVEATGAFGARVSGVVVRLNTDGALSRVERAETSLGKADDLFFRKP